MKRLLLHIIILCCTLCPCLSLSAQDLTDPDVADKTKPIYQEDSPTGKNYLKNRKALVGRHCVVNKLINVVGVGSWIEDLNNLTDEDLNNVATFPKIVSVGVTANPIVSVRDMSAYYLSGTEAGFCIVASSGNSVLSLDVIKALSISLYRDGEFQETISVKEGQSASGVGLSLITIPGSDDACVNLTVKSNKTFDEICLVDAGGVNLSVGDVVKIKYAFVGRVNETPLTNNGMTAFGKETGREGAYLKTAKGWNPVLLGIPFPLLDSEIEKLTNDDLGDYAALTPILTVGYQGGVKLVASPSGGDQDRSELFKAGSEMGFKYMNGSALNLSVGSWIRILLFDKDGNTVQEETVSAGVVNLGIASGGQGTSSIISKVDFSGAEIRFHTVLSVDVGAMGVYYGFVREKPDVAHHCDINPTVDTNICKEQSSFQLESNPELSVTWTLKECPEGSKVAVTPGGYVTNMDLEGKYIFRATAEDGCWEEVTLTHGGFEGGGSICGEPLVNIDSAVKGPYELSDEIYGSSGSLISITELTNPENILNANYDDCAEYVSGLSVANDLRIIGVKKTDGLIYDGGASDARKTKVGFVVELTSEGLNVSALEFFQIRLYNKEKEVYRRVIDETDVVSVGLAGSNRNQKVRFSIEVEPNDKDGNPIRFDEMMLWKSGVLNLTVSLLKIYYPFIEDPTENCSDPLGCGTNVLSADSTGTTINSNATQMIGTIAVAAVDDNLSFLVDNSLDTYMAIVSSVGVGTGSVIAVKMGRTLDYRHQLGLVVDNKTYVAGVQVGGWLTLATYYKGVPTGDEFTDWGVVGVNVIGYGDKNFLLMQPKQMYDEVRLTIAGTVSALDIQKFYGFFLRGDIDNDGTPDCQDPESCFTDIENIKVNDICAGEELVISGTGTGGTDYIIALPEQDIVEKFQTNPDGTFTKKYVLSHTGRYTMFFLDAGGNLLNTFTYIVHPNVTTWKTSPVNADWNEWANWTNGSPYCCTDVVIPSGAKLYPSLDGTVSEDNADEYCCKDIHFEPHAAVEVAPRLNYAKAWVEMELKPNRYYMLSAPLKNMYTGDMFVPAAMKGVQTGDYFTPLTADNTPQNRFNPRIYQRLWAHAAKGRLMDGSEVPIAIATTKWSKNFNHLAYNYPSGYGFSLWVDNGNLPDTQKFRFRFPKEHVEYNYYSDYDEAQLEVKETNLARDYAGRFTYEEVKDGNVTMEYKEKTRTVYTGIFPLTVHLEAEQPTTHFLAGNPFMGHINVTEFLNENKDKGIVAIKVYDGNTLNTGALADGELLSSSTDLVEIAPMQSFFVQVEGEKTGLSVTYTENMLRSVAVNSLQAALPEDARTQAALKIGVESGAQSAGTLLLEGAPDEWERIETLVDNEVKPTLAVFTLSEDRACDVLYAQDCERIPLGIYLAKADTVTFRFEASSSFWSENYVLRDNETGVSYPLEEEVSCYLQGTNINRFELIAANGNTDAPTEENVYVSVYGNRAIVKSFENNLAAVSVYDLSGMQNYSCSLSGVNEAEVPLRKGVHIIRVTLTDCSTRSFKVVSYPL